MRGQTMHDIRIKALKHVYNMRLIYLNNINNSILRHISVDKRHIKSYYKYHLKYLKIKEYIKVKNNKGINHDYKRN